MSIKLNSRFIYHPISPSNAMEVIFCHDTAFVEFLSQVQTMRDKVRGKYESKKKPNQVAGIDHCGGEIMLSQFIVNFQQEYEQLIQVGQSQLKANMKNYVNNNISINQRTEPVSRRIMRQQSKKSTRDPIIISVKKLAENVSKAQLKNTQKYKKIKQINPDFQYKLYKPSIPSYETREELSLAEQIMMRQIDRLMEDEQKLNLELDRNEIKLKEQQKKIQKEIMLNMDHFTFLRKLWKKDQAKQRSDGKIDKLIHNVGAIKGHILNLIKKQSHITQSPPEIHQLIISSPEYCELHKKYEDLKLQMELKQIQEKQQITNNTSESSIESQDIRKQGQQLEAQLANLKLEYLNRNNQLERVKRQNSLMRREIQNSIKKDYEKVRYQMNSIDGSYQIVIRQPKKILEEVSGSDKSIQQMKTLESKHSIEDIIKFLQGAQGRRISRESLGKAKPNQVDNRTRKYTVQEITRPKFISTRLKTTIVSDATEG